MTAPGIYEHIPQLSVHCIHIFLYFLFLPHAMLLYIDIEDDPVSEVLRFTL